VRLSGGKYAVLRAFGPMADLPASFDGLFSDWLPNSDCRQRAGAVFERYPQDARNGPQGMAYEIWVPVARRAGRK
jgi:DNA gyrase inhibitor GyrI